jgi:hypothetical protein
VSCPDARSGGQDQVSGEGIGFHCIPSRWCELTGGLRSGFPPGPVESVGHYRGQAGQRHEPGLCHRVEAARTVRRRGQAAKVARMVPLPYSPQA